MKINYEKELNKEQLEVVKNGDGYVLVLSGPGSGKTRVLTFRVAYLLEKGISPEEVLLLTFTKKAAKEMLARIEELAGPEAGRILGGTFHHVGNYYLRRYAEKLGYSENYTILDGEDSKSLIKMVIDENQLKDDLPTAKKVQAIISLAKNSNENVSEVAKELGSIKASEKIAEVEKLYTEKKKKSNAVDYDDLLLNWNKLLDDSEIRKKIGERFKYILVDEYQDTNAIQDLILKKISSINRNLMVVGDDSQSIYSFRAAEIKNILNFSKKYPAKVFRLETNYRSTPEILRLANSIIKNNDFRLEKDLKSARRSGKNPTVVCLTSPREQARFIVQKLDEDLDPQKTAILFRAHYQAANLELELAKKGIPYIVRGGTRFFEQAHIKDVSAFLRMMVNFKDESSWLRILKKQKGVGDVYARRVIESISELDSKEEIREKKEGIVSSTPPSLKKNVEEVLDLLLKMNEFDKPDQAVSFLIKNWYRDKMEKEFDNKEERMDDLKQLIEVTKEYSDPETMLSDFALSEEFRIDSHSGSLTLSTIHQAKGLEWSNVFVIGLKDGQFPHKKSIEENLIEEERRLFYVAVTRCKNNLFLTYPLFEKRGSTDPSRFLREIEDQVSEQWTTDDEEEIDLIDEDDFDFF